MAFSVVLIAVICFILSLPDICALVGIYGFQVDIRKSDPSDYVQVCRRFGGVGLGYVLLGDVIRTLIAVLLSGVLMKSAGYPEVGKLLALFFTVFFMLVGQAFPVLPRSKPRRSLIYPALILIFVDWRVFLVCAALCGIAYLLTGLRGFSALLAAVILPLFSLIFRSWWLICFMMLLSGFSIASAYLREIWDSLTLLPQRLDDIPLRLRMIGEKIRQKLEEDDEEDNP